MLEVRQLVVLSDLHLGPRQGHGLFQADTELAGFLAWLAREQSESLCLVINGDLLDFLAAKDPTERVLAFDPAAAPERAAWIFGQHPQVVTALAQVAARAAHPLVVLGGNHDPELALPAVQQVIERALCGDDGRQASIRWLVHGEGARFRIGSAEVVVEHGDLFDDWNRIDRNGLRRAVSRISRGFVEEHGFTAPPGSRLVVEFISELREDYPWIELLKPEREAVLPILHYLLPLRRRAAFLRAVQPWLSQQASALFTMGLRLGRDEGLVRDAGDEVTPRRRVRDWLRRKREEIRTQAREEERREVLVDLRQAAAETGYFDRSSPDDAAADVARILDRGTDVVVHGHTHAAKAYRLGSRGLYVNSGTWTHLLELPPIDAPDNEWSEFLERLEQRAAPGAAHPTFVRITDEGEGQGALAELCSWLDGRGRPLARFRQLSSASAWIEEVLSCP